MIFPHPLSGSEKPYKARSQRKTKMVPSVPPMKKFPRGVQKLPKLSDGSPPPVRTYKPRPRKIA